MGALLARARGLNVGRTTCTLTSGGEATDVALTWIENDPSIAQVSAAGNGPEAEDAAPPAKEGLTPTTTASSIACS